MPMNADKFLTILCPIKDRPKYTERFLNYSIREKCPFKLIIADGSFDSDSENISNKVSRYNENIEYIRYPYDKDWKSYLSKMNDSLCHVKTPYIVLACDDDFLDYNAIRLGVNFLEKNKLYCAYGSEVVDFDIFGGLDDGVHGYISIKEKGRHCSGRYKSNQMVDESDLVKRLLRYEDIWPYEYIHKTETLKFIFQLALHLKVDNYHHLLMIMRFATLIMGKVHYNNYSSFLLRQSNTINSMGEIMIREDKTYIHFLANENNFRIHENIIDEMISYICEHNKAYKLCDIKNSFFRIRLQHYQASFKAGSIKMDKMMAKGDCRVKPIFRNILIKFKVLSLLRRIRSIYLDLTRSDFFENIESLDSKFIAKVVKTIHEKNNKK
jgi:glycosyltransferase domain-containing protein